MALLLVCGSFFILPNEKQDNWLMHARVSTPYGYDVSSWEDGLAKAVENNVNVILDWANFSDTYQGRIMHFNDS